MMKYFLPDWEDRLDPDFNFVKDKYSTDHIKNPYDHDCYAHQLFENVPYDGILISLSIFESKMELGNKNYLCKIRNKSNIKEYLKISKNSDLKVMGDCGAFSYVDKDSPPLPFYNVENIAGIYDKLGFDYGVSVDHLAVDYILVRNEITKKREKRILSVFDKKRRVNITIKNAEKFLNLHKKNGYDFTPIGVAQGFDIASYKQSVNALIDMGYGYIAIGGLVQYNSEFILNLLRELHPITKGLKLHLFGVLRPAYLRDFEDLGVSSFDSASFLRKAWLKSRMNYLSLDGNWYSAIRVPQSNNPRLIKNADLNGYSFNDLRKMESRALHDLIQYDKGKVSLDNVLETVLKYDNLLLRGTSDIKDLSGRYFQTLVDQPWKSCNCNLCKELGIQIIIFRGCNRNKRRGFHNIWAFRQISQNII
jgi:hypothetical protein